MKDLENVFGTDHFRNNRVASLISSNSLSLLSALSFLNNDFSCKCAACMLIPSSIPPFSDGKHHSSSISFPLVAYKSLVVITENKNHRSEIWKVFLAGHPLLHC